MVLYNSSLNGATGEISMEKRRVLIVIAVAFVVALSTVATAQAYSNASWSNNLTHKTFVSWDRILQIVGLPEDGTQASVWKYVETTEDGTPLYYLMTEADTEPIYTNGGQINAIWLQPNEKLSLVRVGEDHMPAYSDTFASFSFRYLDPVIPDPIYPPETNPVPEPGTMILLGLGLLGLAGTVRRTKPSCC